MNLHASSAPIFQWLKGLASRMMGRHPPFDRPLDDPSAGVRAPNPRRPSGRSSSVAVAEPESDEFTNAFGRTRR